MSSKFIVKQNRMQGTYSISVGLGKMFTAKDLQEVVYALEHYFRKGVLNKPFNYQKHIEHSKECDCCPLCRR